MRIPVIQQFESSDCGVACVVSISAYYGRDVTISALRGVMGTDATGTSIKGLQLGLESIGFTSRSIYISKDSFSGGDFTLPAIARLARSDGTAHFVAVYKIVKGKVIYMDPAYDQVQVKTLEEFNKDFDGGIIILVPNDEFIKAKEKKRSLFNSFGTLIKPHMKFFVIAIFISVMLTAFGIVMSIFNKTLIDEIIPYQKQSMILSFGILLSIVVVTQAILGAFRSHVILYLSQKIDIPMMLGYFDHIFKLPMKFFETRSTGDITTRFSDAGVVKNTLTNTALTLAIDISMVVIVGVILAMQNVQLFAITLVLVLLSAVLIFIFRAPFRKLNRISMEQGAKMNSTLIGSLQNIETIKVNGAERHTMDKIEAEYIRSLRIGFKSAVTSNIQGTISSVISGLGNLATMLYGGSLVIDGSITLGSLMAFTSLSGYFTGPIGRLIGMQLTLQEADISLKRLSEIYDEKEENEAEAQKEKLNETIEEIELKNVTFSYGTRPPVLKDINIRVGRGEKVALVGRSGCGKTTISKLLLKFYAPTSGAILVNGRDISEIDSFSLRDRMGCVPQNVQTFKGTIRENLLLGISASKEEMDVVCNITGCTEFIRRLPAGYDTMLDESGGGLSGGEKQRLIIARALLRNPDILIMDEATSNMDFITEKMTFDLITKRTKVPMLIIAHRLSTIRSCDRIYVMENGKVIEVGNHDELMERKGYYYELWSSQTGETTSTIGEKKTQIADRDEIQEETQDEIMENEEISYGLDNDI